MTEATDILHWGKSLTDAQVVCTFVHGRGQTPEEMVAQVIDHVAFPGVAWLMPKATGKSWYKARAVDPLTKETTAQLGEALASISAAIDIGRAAGVPLVLAGFSQGACVSLEWLFRHRQQVDACVALTGCRVGLPGDARPAAQLAGLPVLLTGSDDDPWIPVAAFAETVVELGRAQARLRAELYPGRAHTISVAECALLSDVLGHLAVGQPAMVAG